MADRVAPSGTRTSPRDDRRLDGDPQPWHNRSDWLGLSELAAVTRVRTYPGPHLRLPAGSRPKDGGDTTAGAMDAPARMDAHDASTRCLRHRPESGVAQRPQPINFQLIKNPEELRDRTDATTGVQTSSLSRERRQAARGVRLGLSQHVVGHCHADHGGVWRHRPDHPGGRLCTAAVFVAGIGFVAVPIGLIASAMAKVHEEDRAQDRLPPPVGACLSPCSRLNGPKRPRV